MTDNQTTGWLATMDGLLSPIFDAVFVVSLLLSAIFVLYWLMFGLSWLEAIVDGTAFINRLPLDDAAIVLNVLSPVAAALTLLRKVIWSKSGADNA